MPRYLLAGVCAAFSTLAMISAAHSTITKFYNTIPDGITSFDTTVVGAGSIVLTDSWDDFFYIPAMRGGYDVSFAIETRSTYVLPGTGTYSDLTGFVADFSSITDGVSFKPGSVKFDFHEPVNAFGFEIVDWGYCCEPSGLYLAFDEGDPIQVAFYDGGPDGPLIHDERRQIFVGAIDDSSAFSRVEFWTDGVNEHPYGGGTIRYGLLKPASPSPVPLPGAVWLLSSSVLGIASFAKLKRRRRG